MRLGASSLSAAGSPAPVDYPAIPIHKDKGRRLHADWIEIWQRAWLLFRAIPNAAMQSSPIKKNGSKMPFILPLTSLVFLPGLVHHHVNPERSWPFTKQLQSRHPPKPRLLATPPASHTLLGLLGQPPQDENIVSKSTPT